MQKSDHKILTGPRYLVISTGSPVGHGRSWYQNSLQDVSKSLTGLERMEAKSVDQKNTLAISIYCLITRSRSRYKNAGRDGFVYYILYRGKKLRSRCSGRNHRN